MSSGPVPTVCWIAGPEAPAAEAPTSSGTAQQPPAASGVKLGLRALTAQQPPVAVGRVRLRCHLVQFAADTDAGAGPPSARH